MAEAALFAKAYVPSRLAEMTKLWEAHLKEQGLQFAPEQTNTDLEGEIEAEKHLREAFYEQPKQPANEIEEVKKALYN